MRADLGNLFKQACLNELEAMKPGNVHVFADGHGMVVQDFINSAEACAKPISKVNITLGERILSSVQATQDAVKCNTNLGIILLCAPIIQAAQSFKNKPIIENLATVLAHTTLDDADLCFKAIVLANPAGLSASEVHDVNYKADCTLLEAMQAAGERDLIARQYDTCFADIFEFGLTNYLHAFKRWQKPSWAATYVYLNFMVKYLDSHIVRKYGGEVASGIQKEAKQHLELFDKLENPKNHLGMFVQWDADLKARQINPGTSADLTVATLFVSRMIEENNGYI
jgi:triphosphoribosyl-dephospho-CoA synthase